MRAGPRSTAAQSPVDEPGELSSPYNQRCTASRNTHIRSSSVRYSLRHEVLRASRSSRIAVSHVSLFRGEPYLSDVSEASWRGRGNFLTRLRPTLTRPRPRPRH